MHELGVIVEIVKRVEQIAAENEVTSVDALVLQIGELSSMIPAYIQDLFPAAAEGTILEHAELRIEVIPGNGRCRHCSHVYHLIETSGMCPSCGKKDFELLSGKEFMIKEISCC